MMTGDIERYLAVGAGLFALGAIGFLTRRNLIMIFLSVELMMHGVGLTFVSFGRLHHTLEGQVFTIFSLTVAACEAGVALALILAIFQLSKSLDLDLWTDLREAGLPNPASPEELAPPPEQEHPQYPTLTPAGRAPVLDRRTVAAQSQNPCTKNEPLVHS